MERSLKRHRITELARMPWWYLVVGAGAFFIIWTLITPILPDSEWLGVFKQSFNLSLELNLGVWWSSMLLASSALLAFEVSRKVGEDRLGWTGVAVALGVLSVDEMSSFHERSDGPWLLPLAGIAGLLFAVALVRIARSGRKVAAALIAVSFVLFALAFSALEGLNEGAQDGLGKGLASALEEGSEIVGFSLVILAVLLTLKVPRDAPVRILLPRVGDALTRMIVLVILGAGVVAALAYVPQDGRGDPGRWAGAFGFMLVAAAIEWGRPPRSGRLGCAALVSLAASIEACYHLYDVPSAERVLPSEAHYWWASVLAVALWWLARKQLRSVAWSAAALGTPILAIALSPLSDAPRIQHTLAVVTATIWVAGLTFSRVSTGLEQQE